MVSADSIAEAAARIAGHVRETPVLRLEPDAFGVDGRLTLKLESLQHTGSFKARGAFNRLLSAEVPAAGVIASSGGNHGVAVAYAARALGHRAEIFVPTVAAPVKIARLSEYGAHVTVTGDVFADALLASVRRVEKTGALIAHAYDQPEIVAGQGTVAREFESQAPDLDTVLVAVGGGGLIGGIAAWYAGRAKVVGVEPVGCPTLSSALAAGRLVDVAVSGLAADSLGATRTGEINLAIATRHVDRVAIVDDEAIAAAQRALWEELRLIAEPGGATALAALLSDAYRPEADERVGVIICGGNTDPAKIGSP